MPVDGSGDGAIEGVELPPAGTYRFDEALTDVGFVARHMISKVRGRFTSFDGRIEIAERPEDSRVEVEIDAASVLTNQRMRDDHLRSADFLDVEVYPKLGFVSREVRPAGAKAFQLVGDLTIKDVTRELVLDAVFVGFRPGAEGGTLVAFSATAEIDREDWGMTWNVAVETGGVLVGRKVQIEIEVAALLPADDE